MTHTEAARGRNTVLYVFAHQDDEYGINSRIRFDAARGKRVVCVYLTDGGANTAPDKRDAESRAVLRSYGVAAEDIVFMGSALGIADGALHRRAVDAFEALSSYILPIADRLDAVYTLAWEGGHHDHDSTYAIVACVLAEYGISRIGWQFGMYDGAGLRRFFHVMRPPQRGEVIERVLSLREAFRSALQCWRYPSQRRTWIGLFPQAAFRWVFARRELLARIDVTRSASRPHDGPLLYERLFGVSYADVELSLAPLRDRCARIRGS